MPTDVLATVELPSVTGLAKDSCMLDFAFKVAGAYDSTANASIAAAISAFFNEAVSEVGSRKVGQFISNRIKRDTNACIVRGYDLTGALGGGPHGSPAHVNMFTLPAPTENTSLPQEVAAVLTLRATGWTTALVETVDGSDPGSARDRPKQRLSGRLYIGPLTKEAIDGATGKLNVTLNACMQISSQHLATQLSGSGITWAVWSRRDGALRPLVATQVDDAMDTVRGRGEGATDRQTFTVTQTP